MKPPETVTLIDLEGKPITFFQEPHNPSAICLKHAYSYVKSFRIDFNLDDYSLWVGEYQVNLIRLGSNEKSKILRLCHFLNDQLTFIRNGMWETLAIYQATLGRYWEVPFYKTDKELLIELIKICGHTGTWAKCYSYDSNLLEEIVYKDHPLKERVIGTPFKPKLWVFLKHYPDVFSKLEPWKGESTDV